MATDTRVRLGYFIDACVESLDTRELRLTALTRHSWEGLDKEVVERVLWELDEFSPDEVAQMLGLEVEFVSRLSELSGANGRVFEERAA